jgi:UDP-glucose 4-epimerase
VFEVEREFKREKDMTNKISKILVTGGAGFIGSHIVDRLLKDNLEVTVVDNLQFGRMENIAHHKGNNDFHFIKGDIRDAQLVRETMKDFDAVFHEAAFLSVALSVQDPLVTNEINVVGTLNLLKAAADMGIKRFVFASSAAIYGETLEPEKREDEVSSPKSPYGVSKLAAEKYARSFYEVYGLETVSLRYFNVYGPRQSFDIDSAYGGAIVLFFNRLLRNMPPIVYGDGEQTRDFIFIQDVVEANILALRSNRAAGEFMNIGTGTRVSVNQVAETLKHLLKKEKLKNIYDRPRPGDVRHGYANIDKARKILGFKPTFSFDEGARKLVEWRITHADCSQEKGS